MSNPIDKLANSLYTSLKEQEKRKTKAYDTQAVVTRISDDGTTAWVHIDNGVDETPIQKTTNARVGDSVMVRISGHRAWLLGNRTNPATDDVRANQAYQVGTDAAIAANIAIDEANRARAAADNAEEEAIRAHEAADTAVTAAETANLGLSMVEDIVGVLDWIGDHSTITTDTSPVEGKTYYKKNQDGTYTKIEDPTGKNPAQEGWYELDEAIQDFINSHLSLTGTGLYLANMSNGWKVLISSGATQAYPAGVYLIDPNGRTAQATTASGISFDQTKAFTIGNGNAFIYFDPEGNFGQGSITISGSSIQMGSLTLDEILNNTLIYDHTYEYTIDGQGKKTGAIFTAFLYRAGVDVKTEYDPTCFEWILKKEDSDGITKEISLGTGYTKSVSLDDCGYGAEIIGRCTIADDAEALANNGNNLTDSNDDILTIRATGDSVRVRDLTTSTTIFPTDKFMVVGASDEHLISMQTLQDYLNLHLDKQILFGTTAEWEAQAALQSAANTIYIYKDHKIVNGHTIAGIKVGDGNAYLIDLPFTDEAEMEHINNSDIHISAAERLFWNNKVSCYYSSADTLIFTTS